MYARDYERQQGRLEKAKREKEMKKKALERKREEEEEQRKNEKKEYDSVLDRVYKAMIKTDREREAGRRGRDLVRFKQIYPR